MTNQQYVQNIKETFDACLEIVKRKNADYSGTEDAFKGFRNAEVIGVSKERAILVRIMDKVGRVSNLLDKQAEVKDEAIADTLKDLVNYVAILKVMIEDESNTR